jgi:hypothetical protein
MAVEKTKDKTNLEINTQNNEIIIDPEAKTKVGVDKTDERVRIKDEELLQDKAKKISPLAKLIISIGCVLASIALGIGMGIAITNIPTVTNITHKYFSALGSGNKAKVQTLIDSGSSNIDMILPPDDAFESLKDIFTNINIINTKFDGDNATVDAKVDVKDMGENTFTITLKKEGNYLLFFPNWKIENLQASGSAQ